MPKNITFEPKLTQCMRIGMILDTDFPPDSRVENEAVSLQQAGHQVFLFSLSYKPFAKQAENISGIKVRRYKANRLIYKLSAIAYPFPFYHWMVASKIRGFIRENQVEALHVHDMLIAWAAYEANRSFGLPLVLDLHENRPAIMRFYPHLRKLPGRLLISLPQWEKAQEILTKKAERLVLVTEEARQDYVHRYQLIPDKVVVVPNTVHPDIFNRYPIKQEVLQRLKGHFTLLYVGDTGLRRGTDIAIEAMAGLVNAIPGLQLVLVGRSSEDVFLKKLVRRLGLESYVRFEGWQDVSLFPSYIQAADICLSPLKRNQHHDTTYANKIFQYMAMGKPLLVSDSLAQAQVVRKEGCGLVYPAEDVKAMREAILLLYKDSEKRRAMGDRAWKAVRERWNWKVTSRQLLGLYETL